MGLGILLVSLGIFSAAIFLRQSRDPGLQALAHVALSLSPTALLVILLIISYVTVEKFRHRNRMLDMLSWTGQEQVLDVGTGKGLLLIGAAKRLTGGKGIGIDIWNRADLSHNSAGAALRNATIEGVREKVSIQYADAQCLPFPDHSFDYVVSNLCLHNIPTRNGRDLACREIDRVLKPGGTALIADYIHIGQYLRAFEGCGMTTRRSFSFLVAPLLLFIVRAVKAKA